MTAQKTEKKQERTKCEVYSRIVGYLRPVSQWNPGKEAEYYKRQTYQAK
jgi:anaerobic ribonucleoside-triphosphate reductase